MQGTAAVYPTELLLSLEYVSMTRLIRDTLFEIESMRCDRITWSWSTSIYFGSVTLTSRTILAVWTCDPSVSLAAQQWPLHIPLCTILSHVAPRRGMDCLVDNALQLSYSCVEGLRAGSAVKADIPRTNSFCLVEKFSGRLGLRFYCPRELTSSWPIYYR